jgi:hypothetical protein
MGHHHAGCAKCGVACVEHAGGAADQCGDDIAQRVDDIGDFVTSVDPFADRCQEYQDAAAAGRSVDFLPTGRAIVKAGQLAGGAQGRGDQGLMTGVGGRWRD